MHKSFIATTQYKQTVESHPAVTHFYTWHFELPSKPRLNSSGNKSSVKKRRQEMRRSPGVHELTKTTRLYLR